MAIQLLVTFVALYFLCQILGDAMAKCKFPRWGTFFDCATGMFVLAAFISFFFVIWG